MTLVHTHMYIHSVIPDTGTATLFLNLSFKSNLSNIDLTVFALPTTNFTNVYAKHLAAGDRVEVGYDISSKVVHEVKLISAQPKGQTIVASAAAGSSINTKPSQSIKSRSVVYFVSHFIPDPAPTGVIGVIRVSPDFVNDDGSCNGTVYNMKITNSTAIIGKSFPGLVNLKPGTLLGIAFDSYAFLHELYLVGDDISSPATMTTQEDPADYINLCRPGIMFTCSGECKNDREGCHFWVKQSFGPDCSHYRATMGELCDSIPAHIHIAKYGPVGEKPNKKKEPEESWDELLQKMLGKKV